MIIIRRFRINPAIGCCGSDMRQWVEFDTWGQYFGLGVFPCSVVEDMQGRLQRYLDKGVKRGHASNRLGDYQPRQCI